MFQKIAIHINKWGVFWGIVYGLVALGFYFTPIAILFLGLASASTVLALQNILFIEFRWHFAILGLLLVFVTALLYLKKKGVSRLSVADISLHSMYVGTLIIAFAATYALLFWLVALLLRTK